MPFPDIQREHVIEYHTHGLHPIPLHPKSKRPKGLEWQKQIRQPTAYDQKNIFGPSDNIGVICGDEILGRYHVCADLDKFREGMHELLEDRDFWVVKSGRANGEGRHFHFLTDKKIKSRDIFFEGEQVGELKASGQVVSPPSIHEVSGLPYETLRGSCEDMTLLSAEQIDLLFPAKESKPFEKASYEPLTEPEKLRHAVEKVFVYASRKIAGAEYGQRHNVICKYAYWIGGFVGGRDIDRVEAERNLKMWVLALFEDAEEAQKEFKTIKDALNEGAKKPIRIAESKDTLPEMSPEEWSKFAVSLGIEPKIEIEEEFETDRDEIPEERTKFNDLQRARGLEAVRTGVELNKQNPQELVNKTDIASLNNLAGNWEAEPEPVLPITKPQTPFPIESLPHMIREAVTETLDYTQVPIGLACSTALGVAAASVQHLALVARDHQTIGPVSLFVLSILRSGERKSTIFRKMWEGIWKRQRELKEQWDHYQVKDHDKVNPLFDRDSPPKILFEDATVQGLALEIESGIRSVLMSSSEGGTVFGGIGMRGEALMGALAFLNKAWDAEPQSMTRKQAESTYLDEYKLSCLISSQRETIQEWLSKNAGLAEGMGFLARFLICVPESTIGFRIYKQAPEATPKLDRFTDQCLKKLRQKTNHRNLQILHLNDDAHRVWVEYFNFVEAAQGKYGPYEYHTAAASKSAEQAARIAGVFTLLSEDLALEVGLDAMQQGIKIAQWFLDESLRLSGHLTTSKVQRHAEILLEWLKELEPDDENPLRVGEILQIGPRPIRKKKERDDAVKLLTDLGWIQLRKWRNSKIILRHPSIREK